MENKDKLPVITKEDKDYELYANLLNNLPISYQDKIYAYYFGRKYYKSLINNNYREDIALLFAITKGLLDQDTDNKEETLNLLKLKELI